MKKTYNPDLNTNSQEQIKTKINKTKHNFEVANEIMKITDDSQLKRILTEKNERRQAAIKNYSDEIVKNKE